MRKAKPIIIVLSIQLLIAVSLALVNPISDYIVRTKGTEYTFAIEGAEIYGDYTTFVELQCPLKLGFDKDLDNYYDRQYAIIETDESGLSYISALSDNPPEKGDWLGTPKDSFHHFSWYNKKLDYEIYREAEESTDFFAAKLTGVSDEYEITVSVFVYKGKAVLNEIQVNGVEIEDFLNKIAT
ncbi:MAG: hypothetical protein IJZ57_03490 [Clostridia bacterium]|nr:hypothetical protein [Clostridia bacterium]